MEQSQQMKDAIQKAIADNLPGALAGELKQVLIQAEKDAESVRTLTKKVDDRDREVERLRAQLRDQEQIDDQLKQIAQGKQELHDKRLQLAIDTATNAVLVANASRDAMKEAMGLVFRNTEVRSSIFKDVGVPVEGHPGGNGYGGGPGMVMRSSDREDVVQSQT